MEGKGLPTGIVSRDLYPGPDQSFMYCSAEWMTFHNWADQAIDAKGELMTSTRGEPIAIGQLIGIRQYKTTFSTNTFRQKVQLYPYWSLVHKRYILNTLFPGTPLTYYNDPLALGQSYDRSLSFVITICPVTLQLNPALIARATWH